MPGRRCLHNEPSQDKETKNIEYSFRIRGITIDIYILTQEQEMMTLLKIFLVAIISFYISCLSPPLEVFFRMDDSGSCVQAACLSLAPG